MRNKGKAIILSYINILLSNVLNIIYIPIILRSLGTNEYGLYSLCSSIIEYLAVINLGYASAYVRYHSQFAARNDEDGIRSLNGIMLGLYSILGCIVLLGGLFLTFNADLIIGNKFSQSEILLGQKLLFLLSLNLALTFPNSVFSAIITTNEHFVFQRILEIFSNTAIPLIFIPLLLTGCNSMAIVGTTLCVTFIGFIANILYCIKYLHTTFSLKKASMPLVKEILCFSFFLLLQSIVDCINWQVDKIILARICGAVAVAIYTVGSKINGIVLNLSSAIYTVFIPKVNKLIAADADDMQVVSKLFANVGRIQFMIVAYIYCGFLLVGRQFISIWAGSEYYESFSVALLLITPALAQVPETLGVIILRAQGKNGFLNILYFGICVVNVIISIPLTYKYGATGAAMGSCITVLVAWAVIANVYYVKVGKIDIYYFIRNIIPLAEIAMVSVLVCYGIIYFFSLDTKALIFFIAIIYSIMYWTLMFIKGMNAQEKSLLKQYKEKWERKRK